MQMLGFAVSFIDQIDDKTGGDKGQGEHHTDSHKHIYNTVKTEKQMYIVRSSECYGLSAF